MRSRRESPLHCEKQLHYLLIKSLPFLRLSVTTALNKSLSVDSISAGVDFNIHLTVICKIDMIVPSSLIYLE